MRIELNCRECGGNRFTLDQEASDHAHVDCEDCGHHIGTVGELKRLVAEEVMRRARVARPAGAEDPSGAAAPAPEPPLP
jgi:DNA-directed RNA polymerase subunit RPC12/RpoP